MSYFMAPTWPTMKRQAVTWHLWSDKCQYDVSRGSTWDKKILRLVKITAKQGLRQASGGMHAVSCRSPPALAAWMNTHSKPAHDHPLERTAKRRAPAATLPARWSHLVVTLYVTRARPAKWEGIKWELVNFEPFYPPSLKFSITFKTANCSLCFSHKHSIWNVKQLTVFIPVSAT